MEGEREKEENEHWIQCFKKKKEGKPGKQKQNAKESAKGHSQGLTK